MSAARVPGEPAVLAEVWRSGFCEGAHRGHAVLLDRDGSVLRSYGDPALPCFPRSSNKPAQATAMLRAGLDLEGELLALAAASHSGEPFHVQGVRRVFASAGLDASALQTPPDQPLDPVVRDSRVAAGLPPLPLLMNCSGKHAAMLATCVAAGWPVDTYLDPEHPLQRAVVDTVADLSGEPVAARGVDGCGAPVLAVSLLGLARTFRRLVTAPAGSPERRVADAMRAHPEWVGGTRRDVTAFMRGIPGLLAKDGAEGVYAAALPDGRAVALKVEDGADRARRVVMAALLRALGVTGEVLDTEGEWVLLGGGRRVGEVRATV